jgi:hypothetical protein
MMRERYGSAFCADSVVRCHGEPDAVEAFGILALTDEVDLVVNVRPSRGLSYRLIAAHERNV